MKPNHPIPDDEFTRRVAQRLEFAELEPPADMWARIEAALPPPPVVAEGASMAPQGGQPMKLGPKRFRILAWVYSAAASLLVLAVFGLVVYNTHNRGGLPQPDLNENSLAQERPQANAPAASTAPTGTLGDTPPAEARVANTGVQSAPAANGFAQHRNAQPEMYATAAPSPSRAGLLPTPQTSESDLAYEANNPAAPPSAPGASSALANDSPPDRNPAATATATAPTQPQKGLLAQRLPPATAGEEAASNPAPTAQGGPRPRKNRREADYVYPKGQTPEVEDAIRKKQLVKDKVVLAASFTPEAPFQRFTVVGEPLVTSDQIPGFTTMAVGDALTQDYQSLNRTQQPRFSFMAGVAAQVPLPKNFFVSGGLDFQRMSTSTQQQAGLVYSSNAARSITVLESHFERPQASLLAADVQNVNLTTNLNYLAIPIRAGWRIGSPKVQWVISAGLGTNFYVGGNIQSSGPMGDESLPTGNSSPIQPVFLDGQVSTGVQYRFHKMSSLVAEPSVRYALTNTLRAEGLTAHPLTVGMALRFLFHVQ